MPKFSKRSIKDLDGLPDALRAKAEALIDRLDEEPALGKKLRGALEGKRSVRLGRTHRIIYTADDGVLVLTVVPRKDAYR